MITMGVDLATEPAKTGMGTIRWGDGRAVLADRRLDVDDDAIVEAAATSTTLGLDYPLG